MCWSLTATITATGLGVAATGLAIAQGQPRASWVTLGYFTAMEALQVAGYSVIDQCGISSNQTIALLSFLHIVFQPFFINAFAMELVPNPVKQKIRRWVYFCCALSSSVMLIQLYPFSWAGSCNLGAPLCGTSLCIVSGEWHIAWNVPYNGMLQPLAKLIGIQSGFPTYLLTVFVMPLIYGAWRFTLFHALAGPILAMMLTPNPNEVQAVWCLFSIGILLIGTSPLIRKQFTVTAWWVWPTAWRSA